MKLNYSKIYSEMWRVETDTTEKGVGVQCSLLISRIIFLCWQPSTARLLFNDSFPPFQSAMLSCPMKPSVYRLPIQSMCRSILPNVAYATELSVYPNSCVSVVNKTSPRVSLVLSSSFTKQYPCRKVYKDNYPGLTPHGVESCNGEQQSDLSEETNFTENIQVDSAYPVLESEEDEKIERRKTTVHGNKGKVPWNKGRKHSEETRARIRQRTKEALKDPKVRKKMSEAPRALSNQTKEKIRTSLRKLWGQRMESKRTKEKLLRLWADSIACAAKKGGLDQEELEWDSYDKLKQEIALLKAHQAAEKAYAKKAARSRAERAAHLKAEKMAILAQRRREREENTRARGESVQKRERKSKEEKEKLAECREVKLKERLMKIHRKKSTINRVSSQHQRQWEKLDLNFMKRAELHKEIPLADQIRSAKNRRAKELIDKL